MESKPLIVNDKPEVNQVVVVYLSNGTTNFAKFKKVFTFSGIKEKFVHGTGLHFKDEHVINWGPVPASVNECLY